MADAARDRRYLELLLDPVRACAKYKPNMGQGAGNAGGLSLDEFRALYGADPFYSWFGLDNPLMYTAHKAAGGMTSVYRQIGIGAERLFRAILQDELGLTEDEASWSYTIEDARGKRRELSLDGRIELELVKDKVKRSRVRDWVLRYAQALKVSPNVAESLAGTVFEVRQGYKSKDSKRQNADIGNAAAAYTKAFLPCVVVMSTQIDADLVTRYRNEKWAIVVGTLGGTDLESTYRFTRDVVGYDLAAFLSTHAGELRKEVQRVLEALLKP